MAVPGSVRYADRVAGDGDHDDEQRRDREDRRERERGGQPRRLIGAEALVRFLDETAVEAQAHAFAYRTRVRRLRRRVEYITPGRYRETRPMAVHSAAVTINAPVHQVYELYTHFNDYPKFMTFVK